MAKLLKLRRGTTTQHGSFTGAEGEVTVDTDKETLVVHDGSTAGGHPVAAEDMANVSSASIAGRLGNDSIATSKIAAGALPTDVTVASANIVTGTIATADIGADQITSALIADDQIDSEHYVDGSIDHAHLSNDCIDGDNIQDDVINSEHIAAGAVDLEHMSSESVDEDNLQISNAGTNGQYLQKQSGNTGGLTWATVDLTKLDAITTSSGVILNGVTATTQSASDNSTKVATTAYTDTAISNLVDSSPGALNTLNELAAAINDDASFSTTITNSIATKMPLAGGEFTGDVTCHNITPDGDSTRNLGTNSVRFANIYGDTLYGDGSNLTGIVSFVQGMIILWSGAANAIPSGWVLCDGNNSTPNLSGKFVVGYSASDGDYDVDDTGGSATVTLTTAQLPAHNHTTSDHSHSFSGSGSSSHTHTVGGTLNSGNRGMGYSANMANGLHNRTTSSATVSLTISGTTGNAAPTTANTGSGNAHENRPPFYALCYIMKS